MPSSFFVYAGRSSLDFGICVEKCPAVGFAGRLVEKISVPGRNGSLLIDTGSYENVSQTYEIWFRQNGKNTHQAARDIAMWLLSGQGYLRLEDSYDLDVFRRAVFSGPVDIENWMLVRGRAALQFDCKPQRFLKSGESWLSVTAGQKLTNPWMPALPLVKISGSGSGILEIGASAIAITGLSGTMTIDSDTQDAYAGSQNKNNSITVTGGFPVLQTGQTSVSFSGGITAVSIMPRWWTL